MTGFALAAVLAVAMLTRGTIHNPSLVNCRAVVPVVDGGFFHNFIGTPARSA